MAEFDEDSDFVFERKTWSKMFLLMQYLVIKNTLVQIDRKPETVHLWYEVWLLDETAGTEGILRGVGSETIAALNSCTIPVGRHICVGVVVFFHTG